MTGMPVGEAFNVPWHGASMVGEEMKAENLLVEVKDNLDDDTITSAVKLTDSTFAIVPA